MLRLAAIWMIGVAAAAGGCSRIATSHRLARQPRHTVRLAGAQVPTEFVASWAGHCQTENLSIEFVQPVSKSHYGFKALRQGRADLACTSRCIAWYELDEYAADRGGKPTGLRVATKAFALYVHPSNLTKSLTAGQLKQIYRQKSTQWSSLGWPDGGPITLYGPPRASQGGQLLMILARAFVVEPPWKQLQTPDEIIAAVRSDTSALGFAPLELTQGVRSLSIAPYQGDRPVEPSYESVLRDDYVLSQVIYLWTTNPPSEGAAALIAWLFDPAGASAIRATGYHPVDRQDSAVVLPQAPAGASGE